MTISTPLLRRARCFGCDNERMAFGFSMLNGGRGVQCQIGAAAIDKLIGGPRGSCVDREIQFSQLRETIGRFASATFDAGAVVRGSVVRIFVKDIPKAARWDDFGLTSQVGADPWIKLLGKGISNRIRRCGGLDA